MLAYAVDRRPAGRDNSPRTLLLIVAGHAGLIAAVMASKMELPVIGDRTPTEVTLIETPPPPPPDPVDHPPRHAPSIADRPTTIIPFPNLDPLPLDQGPPVTDIGPIVGPADPPVRPVLETPVVVRKAARFATPAGDVRPPYPESKRREAEEASLKLALEIDARGRVTSVEPVGAADPVFLDAARQHIVKRWRYRPATEDGQAIASRTVITLQFKLEE